MNPFGQGWHLDRAAFDESLRERLRLVTAESDEPAGILKGKFVTVQKDDGLWVVTTVANRVNQDYRSRWLVDASGRKASVAQKVHRQSLHT
jgi:flavin-dependent dehydrogenase